MGLAHTQLVTGAGGAPGERLHRVRQLVDEQLLAAGGVRREHATGKVDICPDGERLRAERARGTCSRGVGVNANRRQRDAELALHLALQRGRQRLACTALAERVRDRRVVRIDHARARRAAIQRRGRSRDDRRLQAGHRARHFTRAWSIEIGPPVGFGEHPRGSPRRGARERRCCSAEAVADAVAEAVVDGPLDLRGLAHVGAEPATGRCDPRGEIVKPWLRRELIVARDLAANMIPDRPRDIGRQPVLQAGSDRIERALRSLRRFDITAAEQPRSHRGLPASSLILDTARPCSVDRKRSRQPIAGRDQDS
jgi:hypothetical protein